MRLEDDLDLDKKIQVALPRFSFEMTGLSYDSSRKQNTNVKNFAQTGSGVVAQYNPVPYDFDFSLYLYVRNIEDATQVLEHIIPYFTPDYTIKLNLIPEMGITKEIPIVLNSTNYEVNYEGPRDSDPRMIIWTLNFTVKGFIFGASSGPVGLIKNSITNIYSDILQTDIVSLTTNPSGLGQYQVGEIVYQGYSYQTQTASAKVVLWSNNVLHLTDIKGNFVSNQPIYGINTNASYQFTGYNVLSKRSANLASIVVTPNPPTANATDPYTYTTTITEY